MTIGTFTLIRNEAVWIRDHLINALPWVDQMVFFDGNSDDGTLEVLYEFQDSHAHGHKLTIIPGKDPKNLRDDYVKMFNDCLHTLWTDYALFLHPDMLVDNPEQIRQAVEKDAVAMTTNMTSYAGEPGGQLYRIDGRGEKWKNIYRLRKPDLGAHYHGHYGSANEDVYFSSITGDSHEFYGTDFEQYPYKVEDSGINIHHFSDVRHYARRLQRMERCLVNQGYPQEKAARLATEHPRVTLKDTQLFKFVAVDHPLGRKCA